MEELEIGQAWVFPEVENAPPLLAAIGALDNVEYEDGTAGRIVSVRVSPHPKARELSWAVGHMPVMEDAFLSDGAQLAPERVELGPEFAEGYATWRSAFDDGKAGAFALTISQAYLALVAVAAESAANG